MIYIRKCFKSRRLFSVLLTSALEPVQRKRYELLEVAIRFIPSYSKVIMTGEASGHVSYISEVELMYKI